LFKVHVPTNRWTYKIILLNLTGFLIRLKENEC